MNLKNSFEDALSRIKRNEEIYTTLVQNGSTDPFDYHYMSYFSGVHNGFKFVWHILDNNIDHKEFKELLRQLLEIKKEVKN